MGVLQQQPHAVLRGSCHVVASYYLLPLAHGDPKGFDLLALPQVLYQLCRVSACEASQSINGCLLPLKNFLQDCITCDMLERESSSWGGRT